METPKPKPPVKAIQNIKIDLEPAKEALEGFKRIEPKKPFIVKPHLTQKPFRGNEELLQLKKRLSKPKFQNR